MPFRKRLADSFNKLPPGDRVDFFTAVVDNDATTAAAILERHPDATQWTDGGGNTALMMAVLFGPACSETIELLLKNGAEVNARNNHGGNALARAACFGHIDLVKTLLAAGADVHMKDAAGQDAAAWANSNGHAEIAALVLSAQKASPRQTPPHKGL